MTNIIQYPIKNTGHFNKRPENVQCLKQSIFRIAINRIMLFMKILFLFLIGIFWGPIQVVWSIDCFYQMLRMFYYWDTPGVHAGLTFLIHFSLWPLLVFFIMAEPRRN